MVDRPTCPVCGEPDADHEYRVDDRGASLRCPVPRQHVTLEVVRVEEAP